MRELSGAGAPIFQNSLSSPRAHVMGLAWRVPAIEHRVHSTGQALCDERFRRFFFERTNRILLTVLAAANPLAMARMESKICCLRTLVLLPTLEYVYYTNRVQRRTLAAVLSFAGEDSPLGAYKAHGIRLGLLVVGAQCSALSSARARNR